MTRKEFLDRLLKDKEFRDKVEKDEDGSFLRSVGVPDEAIGKYKKEWKQIAKDVKSMDERNMVDSW